MRDIVVDLWKTTRFNMGYVGEDEATRLIFQLTTDLMTSKPLTIEFNVNGEITVINDISPIDNSIIYVVPEIFTTAEGDIGIQVVGYNDGKVIKSPVVYGRISKSQVGDSGIPLKAYHTHDNKNALHKFGEDEDGNPTYNGEPIGGENTIYIPAKLNWSSDPPTIETSATFEQVDTAYKLGQEQILRVIFDEDYEDTRLLSLVAPIPGNVYYFGTILGENSVFAGVVPSDEWVFEMSDLTKTSASNVSYSDTTVKGALDVLVPKSHTHDNKTVLDKLSVAGGKLQYDGSDVGLKGEKGDKGDTGATGAQGEPGKDGADGKDGAPGADGTSATHSWNGTVLTITSASGTSSADLKGEKGDKGDKGDTGSPGQTGAQGEKGEKGDKGDTGAAFTYSDFTAEQLAALKGEPGDKGDKGDTGAAGADGYTPVKGTDYWTPADKQEIVADTLAALPTWTGGSY